MRKHTNDCRTVDTTGNKQARASRLAAKGGTLQFYSSTNYPGSPHIAAKVARRPNLQRYIDVCTLLKQHNDVRPTKLEECELLALLDSLSRAHSWDD